MCDQLDDIADACRGRRQFADAVVGIDLRNSLAGNARGAFTWRLISCTDDDISSVADATDCTWWQLLPMPPTPRSPKPASDPMLPSMWWPNLPVLQGQPIRSRRSADGAFEIGRLHHIRLALFGRAAFRSDLRDLHALDFEAVLHEYIAVMIADLVAALAHAGTSTVVSLASLFIDGDACLQRTHHAAAYNRETADGDSITPSVA